MDTEKERALELSKKLNQALGSCLGVITPPIQYTQSHLSHPTHKEAKEQKQVDTCINDLMLHAKQLEMFFMDKLTEQGSEAPFDICEEIEALENELSEKNELIEKYTTVLETWDRKLAQSTENITALLHPQS